VKWLKFYNKYLRKYVNASEKECYKCSMFKLDCCMVKKEQWFWCIVPNWICEIRLKQIMGDELMKSDYFEDMFDDELNKGV